MLACKVRAVVCPTKLSVFLRTYTYKVMNVGKHAAAHTSICGIHIHLCTGTVDVVEGYGEAVVFVFPFSPLGRHVLSLARRSLVSWFPQESPSFLSFEQSRMVQLRGLLPPPVMLANSALPSFCTTERGRTPFFLFSVFTPESPSLLVGCTGSM